MKKIVSYLHENQWVFFSVVTLFYISQLLMQVNSARSVAVADSIAYITTGINFIQTGDYINHLGDVEVWFPPVLPILIGSFSLLTPFEPHDIARSISAISGFISLFLVFAIAKSLWSQLTAIIATLLVIANPLFQYLSTAALSELLASTFALVAFYSWVKNKNSNCKESDKHFNLTTATFLAIATMTRPEYIALFVIWFVLDIFSLQRLSKKEWGRALTSGAIFLLLITPYCLFLKEHTGKFTISNKGAVNVAHGQAEYYGGPRQLIDKESLELKLVEYPDDHISELKRYVYNIGEIWKGYSFTYKMPLNFLVCFLVVFATVSLFVNKRYSILIGILGGLAYLVPLAHYAVQPRYLYGTVPFISLLCAYSVRCLLKQCFPTSHSHWVKNTTGSILILFLVVFTLEGYTRYPRWEYDREYSANEFLRDAGKSIQSEVESPCVLYDFGATLAFYSNCRRGPLAQNDFETIVQYISVNKGHEVAYLSVFNGYERYYAKIKDFNIKSDTRFQQVLSEKKDGYDVTIYKFTHE